VEIAQFHPAPKEGGHKATKAAITAKSFISSLLMFEALRTTQALLLLLRSTLGFLPPL